jgi:hypothetical protein
MHRHYAADGIGDRALRHPAGIKRTLDGAEIDKIISDVEAGKALAIERRRRADWRKREVAASRFRSECDQLDAARLPHIAPDQVP